MTRSLWGRSGAAEQQLEKGMRQINHHNNDVSLVSLNLPSSVSGQFIFSHWKKEKEKTSSRIRREEKIWC